MSPWTLISINRSCHISIHFEFNSKPPKYIQNLKVTFEELYCENCYTFWTNSSKEMLTTLLLIRYRFRFRINLAIAYFSRPRIPVLISKICSTLNNWVDRPADTTISLFSRRQGGAAVALSSLCFTPLRPKFNALDWAEAVCVKGFVSYLP